MSNIRNTNIRVYNLEKEVRAAIGVLRNRQMTQRTERQLVDGAKFLEMIKHTPYNSCPTVTSLKEKISKERNKLKDELEKLETLLESENEFNISEGEKKKLTLKVEKLKDEIQWLHKCLGICKNADYFK